MYTGVKKVGYGNQRFQAWHRGKIVKFCYTRPEATKEVNEEKARRWE